MASVTPTPSICTKTQSQMGSSRVSSAAGGGAAGGAAADASGAAEAAESRSGARKRGGGRLELTTTGGERAELAMSGVCSRLEAGARAQRRSARWACFAGTLGRGHVAAAEPCLPPPRNLGEGRCDDWNDEITDDCRRLQTVLTAVIRSVGSARPRLARGVDAPLTEASGRRRAAPARAAWLQPRLARRRARRLLVRGEHDAERAVPPLAGPRRHHARPPRATHGPMDGRGSGSEGDVAARAAATTAAGAEARGAAAGTARVAAAVVALGR